MVNFSIFQRRHCTKNEEILHGKLFFFAWEIPISYSCMSLKKLSNDRSSSRILIIFLLNFFVIFLLSGFSWTDGKPLAFVNWYTNEPYPLNRHLCAGFNSGGKWQDEPCYLKFPSICKRPLGKRYFMVLFNNLELMVSKASLQ